MSDKTPRLERAIAELMQAMANVTGALAAELRRLEATVAPHSHPPESGSPAAAPQPAAMARALPCEPVEDCLDVSSPPAPAEPVAPSAASSPERKWTEERLVILRETYPAGVPLDDIRRRLEAAPGKAGFLNKRIAVQAAQMGLRRPAKAQADGALDSRAAGGGTPAL